MRVGKLGFKRDNKPLWRPPNRASNKARVDHCRLADDGRPIEPLSSIVAPTLVIHGTVDPMFPLEQGQALADEIPGATLLSLEGGGHGVARAVWETIARAILEHTV